MNHAFSKIWILVILVVFIVGGILVCPPKFLKEKFERVWQYFGVLKEEGEDETASWKTYRNDEYGFEIKYPSDWIIDEETLVGPPPLYVLSFLNQQELEGGRMEIDIQTTKASSVLDLAREAYGSPLKEIRLKEGIIGQQFTEEEGIFTAFLKDNFLYQFVLKQEPRKSKIETIYNQMLSTFRFLE